MKGNIKAAVALLALALPLAAQTGNYHFVEMSVRSNGVTATVRNAGGRLNFAGPVTTGVSYTGFSATNGAEAAPISGTLAFNDGALATPLSDKPLALRVSPDGALLTAAVTDGDNFDLLFAVRAGETVAPIRGAFNAAYFGIGFGELNRMATAFADFTADGAGNLTRVIINGHTSARDDVNRVEQPAAITYSHNANGLGVMRFPAPSDYVTGDRELMISADGMWLLAYGRGAGERDIFIGRRRDADRAAATLDGLYWINELTAEMPFAFDGAPVTPASTAGRVRFSSAVGTLRADGLGRAEISEQVSRLRNTGAGAITNWITTANAYYTEPGNRAALVADLTTRNRNNFHFAADGFFGGHVGTVGAVTLEHGIWAGIRADAGRASGVQPMLARVGAFNAASFAIAPAAPLAYVTLFGANLAASTATAPGYPFPTELAGTRVLVNGRAAPLAMVSSDQINFQWPATTGASATIQVSTAAGTSNALTVPVAATTPGIFAGAVLHANYQPVTSANPARPGETLLIFANGLGAVNPAVESGAAAPANPLSRVTDASLRVFLAGNAALVEFAGLAPGFAGLYQLNIRVPDEAVTATAAPLAIATSDTFTDLAEVPVRR